MVARGSGPRGELPAAVDGARETLSVLLEYGSERVTPARQPSAVSCSGTAYDDAPALVDGRRASDDQ